MLRSMSKRPASHTITETRDWARIVLAAGFALAFVVLAVKGDITGSTLVAALGHVFSLLPQ